MSRGSLTVAVYDGVSEDTVIGRVVECCREMGAEIDLEADTAPVGSNRVTTSFSYRMLQDTLIFHLDPNRSPTRPIMNTGIGGVLWPQDDTTGEYQRRMDAILEFVCKLASCLEASYVPLFESEGDPGPVVVPDGRPIAEYVDTPPRFGIYSQEVLDGLGGVEALFDHPYWYTAAVDDERTLAIAVDREAPWMDTRFNDTTWIPPTDVAYLQHSRFNALPDENGDDGSVSTVEGSESTDSGTDEFGLSDPFAALEPGSYATDLCVPVEDVGAEFRNEDLRLVRVYVDEAGDLRRTDTDAFVRNVVRDGPDDNEAFVDRQFAAVPGDADESDLMISALLHGAIPPSFIALDAPDGETVVSRVAPLDIESNKVELLIQLGRAAQYEQEGLGAGDISAALDTLAEINDPDAVDRLIRERLL